MPSLTTLSVLDAAAKVWKQQRQAPALRFKISGTRSNVQTRQHIAQAYDTTERHTSETATEVVVWKGRRVMSCRSKRRLHAEWAFGRGHGYAHSLDLYKSKSLSNPKKFPPCTLPKSPVVDSRHHSSFAAVSTRSFCRSGTFVYHIREPSNHSSRTRE